MIFYIIKNTNPAYQNYCQDLKYFPYNSNAPKRGPAVVFENAKKELDLINNIKWGLCTPQTPPCIPIDIMWILSEVSDLHWAVNYRQSSTVKELWAGPNLVVVPEEGGAILTNQWIDKIIVPCEWVYTLYNQTPGLKDKIIIWATGLDLDYWTPNNRRRDTFLIYNKFNDALTEKISSWIGGRGLKYELITYGQYCIEDYRSKLERAKGLIWLSKTESQGIALLEAMAMNVPVLCYENYIWEYYSPELSRLFTCHFASSAPYFSDECGIRFHDFEEFVKVFDTFTIHLSNFTPRNYLIQNNLVLGKSLSVSLFK
jgi:hypothetical protein